MKLDGRMQHLQKLANSFFDGKRPEPIPELYKQFMALSFDEKQKLLNRAKLNKERGTCFMCKRIVDKSHYNEFPKMARSVHLMLCCYGRDE